MARKGFTLLEVILATTIALLLMYGLYTAIDVQLKYADQGRERVEHATLARSLFNRIEADVTPSIGFPDPGRFKDAAEAAQEDEATTDTPDAATTDQGATNTDAMTTEEPTTSTLLGDSPENALTVKGNSEELVVFVSRVPREAFVEQQTEEDQNVGNDATGDVSSDQRRITYWLHREGSDVAGLARREERLTTSAAVGDIFNLQAESNDGTDYVIAREVTALQFRYWNSAKKEWQDTWDGATLSTKPDGTAATTPVGAPAAIEVILTVKLAQSSPSDPIRTRKYRHVIYVPTSDGIEVVTEGEEPAP